MKPDRSELVRVFGRIGVQSFGGPAAQIALMHKELVEDRNWLSEKEFLRALSFCMLLPGPEAMQLATYAGWRMQGIVGGLIAGGLFVLPGAAVVACLALAYGTYGDLPLVQSAFLGIQAAVIAIVFDALRKVGKRALHSPTAWAVAFSAFLALFLLQVPFPLVIGIAALIGWIAFDAPVETPKAKNPNVSQAFHIILVGLLVWAAPLALAVLAGASFLEELGFFFSKLAVVTFGGAYAVLAYMAQVVVTDFNWLTAPQMLDALGLAETTPGPLILVTQFVAMLAGLSEGGVGQALQAGLMALWVTFVPCFIWIFAGAPLIDWLSGQARLQAALSGITAAVVGVIANLSLWFAMHVFFQELTYGTGTLKVLLPNFGTIQMPAVALTILAIILLQRVKLSLLWILVICALAALGLAELTAL